MKWTIFYIVYTYHANPSQQGRIIAGLSLALVIMVGVIGMVVAGGVALWRKTFRRR